MIQVNHLQFKEIETIIEEIFNVQNNFLKYMLILK
jgi:hypothetical protein